MGEINDIGGISLSLFQGIVMITLPLLLAGQTVLMFVFARYAVFNIIGRDYDAAVLSSGICGFDMGATTNAMANMQALSCSGRNEPTRSGSAATVWSRRNLLCRRSTPAAPTRTLPPAEEPITYHNVAIPEIHLKRKRKPRYNVKRAWMMLKNIVRTRFL